MFSPGLVRQNYNLIGTSSASDTCTVPRTCQMSMTRTSASHPCGLRGGRSSRSRQLSHRISKDRDVCLPQPSPQAPAPRMPFCVDGNRCICGCTGTADAPAFDLSRALATPRKRPIPSATPSAAASPTVRPYRPFKPVKAPALPATHHPCTHAPDARSGLPPRPELQTWKQLDHHQQATARRSRLFRPLPPLRAPVHEPFFSPFPRSPSFRSGTVPPPPPSL